MSVTEVRRAVAKRGNPRTRVSFGAGEELAGTRQLHAHRVGGSAAWMTSPDGLSDSKPGFSMCAKARSRADSDLLAITEAKEERDKKE